MNTFKVGRLGASYCWRIGSLHHRHVPYVLRARCLQKRHYADRYTFDDKTQARIDEIYKPPANVELPRENPWRGDFPKNLDDIGYDSHCNDRLYMAKNNYRHTQQEYDQKRQERRQEAQERIQKHFSSDLDNENSEKRKLSIMQDLAEHQKRQEDIIEMNRKLWQSRPQIKREINLSGITYRPDQQQQLVPNARHMSQDHDGYRERSEAEKGEAEAEAETNYWVRKQMGINTETKAEAENSDFQRRMKRLMGRYNADQEAEKAGWRTRKPQMGEAEAEGQPRGPALQRRLKELMEAEGKPEAEECDWRVKSPRAEAEEEDWRIKRSRGKASEEDWRVKNPRAEAEECDWRIKGRKPEAEECDWRVKSPRAEAEECDWRIKGRNPEAEECDWRVKSPRAEAEECDWRMKSRWPDSEECDWRVKSPKAEAEECDWRIKGRKPDSEECDWRVKNPKAEAEECDWRVKSPRAEEDWRMRSRRPEAEEEDWRFKPRSQSMSSMSLQRRLMKLMEAEKKPEAEDDDWRPDPKAEAEGSPRAEAETKDEAEDKAWKARNLSPVYDPNLPSKSWQKKREKEIEAQYWHSWNSCPNNQEAETTVELKQHPRRKKGALHPPPYTRGGQKRSYHQAALNPQPLEAQPEPLANAPLMPKPLRAVPKKEKKAKPKRKRERRSVEPPRFKMTIRTLPLVTRRPAPVPSGLRRLNILSEVAGPNFHMDNLQSTILGGRCVG